METRLERQFRAMNEKLEKYSKFANEKQEIFNNDLNQKIFPILKKYKLVLVEPNKNTFIDEKVIGSGLIFRVYLDIDFSSLSHKQIKNIEKALREKGVPMPICPISSYSLSLCYHD